MERLNTVHHDADPGAGTAVAVMFAQMQDQIAS
jgi:hypothetical protein